MRDDPCTGIYHKYTPTGTYDTSTSEMIVTQVDIPCQVLLQDLTRNFNGLSSVFGKEILAGDKECYLLPPNKANSYALPLVIDTTSDRITIAGVLYKVEVCKSADPTGANPILHQLMLRR